MTATYATPIELARFVNIEGKIPSLNVAGASRIREIIGTGDNTNKLFYTDQSFLIADSYHFYYGATETAALANALTETTHYTIDKDTGIITLTAAGVTAVGTNNIYGDYSYIVLNNVENMGVSNTMLQEALNRAQDDLDQAFNTHYCDGSVATPDYTQVTDEKYDGKGKYDRTYFLLTYPLPDFSTTIATACVAADTTVYVASTKGFPSSGNISVEADKITYTGKTGHSFTGCTSVEAHATAKTVHPYVIEISTSDSGYEPTFETLQIGSDVDINYRTGRIYLYIPKYDLTYYALQYPPKDIANRFRISYLYGYDTIHDDVKRCTLMVAAKELIHSAMRRSLINGQTVDKMSADIDEEWIKETIEQNKSIKILNT